MANPTTYFGWVMPNSADLVTDLPADFNVFGQGVDTSMQYLLGGTTGQILSKTSATNMAFTWINNDQGDITGVTAGTGISGGGTSGTVTVSIDTAVTVDKTTAQTLTNKTLTSPALTTPTISTATTNGDLLYGTGSGALSRLGIGSTSQVLTVTGGVPVWATPASGSTYIGASCYTTVQLTVPHNTDTAITYNSEFFDTDSFHSTSSNTSRFTIPAGKSGKYLCAVSIQSDGSGSEMGAYLKIYKNGSFFTGTKKVIRGGSEPMNTDFSQVIDLTATDYIQFYIYQNSGASRNFFSDNALAGAGYGQITYLGA